MKPNTDLDRIASEMAVRITAQFELAEAPFRTAQEKILRGMEPLLATADAVRHNVQKYEALQESFQKSLEPMRAVIERIEAESRRTQELIEKAIRASRIDFEAIVHAMEEDRKRFPEEMRILAQHGWYVQPRMTPREHRKICAALAAGRAAEVEAGLVRHFDGELDEIETQLCRNSPARERILRSAFAAHRRGDFAASIPLMLAQADGICRDYTGAHLFSRRERLEAWIKAGKPSLLMYFAALVERTPMNAPERDRADKPEKFNRHAIMHGELTDYDTASNGARAVSLLVYIDWVLGEIPRQRPAKMNKR